MQHKTPIKYLKKTKERTLYWNTSNSGHPPSAYKPTLKARAPV